MKELFETFLVELAKVLGFPNLTPDEQGACLISMKQDNAHLLFEFDSHLVPYTILLSTPLLPISVEHRYDLFEETLKGNDTIEETLSFSPEDEILYLHRRIHPNIQADDLDQILASFLKQIKIWKERIEEIKKGYSHREEPRPPFFQKIFPNKV